MKRALPLLLLVAACATPPPPAPVPEPVPATAPAAPGEERVVGNVRVSASTLNVRAEASASAEIVSHARRGEKLAVLEDTGAWLRVRLADGSTGWVSSQHVTREGAAARPRRSGCPPDSDFSFITPPKPAFSENATAHGIVVVEAGVSAKGDVLSTRLVSNSTGDPALATLTENELRAAKFSPPVRGCVAKAFIYTYKRSF